MALAAVWWYSTGMWQVLHTWCHGSNKQLRSLWHEVSRSWICNRLALPFQACNDFQNNGTCVTQCPPAMIYDPDLFQIVPNPDYRLAAGDLCVEQCPGEKVCSHWGHRLFYFALEVLATHGMFTSTFSYCYYCYGNWQLCVGPSLAVLLVLVVTPPTDFVLSNKIFYQTLQDSQITFVYIQPAV